MDLGPAWGEIKPAESLRPPWLGGVMVAFGSRYVVAYVYGSGSSA